MKLKITAVLLFTTFFLSTATAQKEDLSVENRVVEEVEALNLTEVEEMFNRNTENIPGFIGSLIGDQTIAVNLSRVDMGEKFLEKDVIGIEMEGKKVSDLKWGEFEDTTLRVWIDQEDLDKISSSERPFTEFKNLMKNGEIRYETYTLMNRVRMTLASLFLF